MSLLYKKTNGTKAIIFFIALMITTQTTWAQWGPGGVGNTNGTLIGPTRVQPAMRGWYRADNGPGIVSGKVQNWQDRSGRNIHVSQSDAALQPEFVTNAVNSRPVVRFSGVPNAMLQANPKLHCIPPASYLDMVALESAATLILTDSGGVQREAYFFEKPCIILNEETPWPELLEHGSTLLGSTEPAQLLDCAKQLMAVKDTLHYPPIFGDGKAAEFIVATIFESHS
jgi:hypothetical protein